LTASLTGSCSCCDSLTGFLPLTLPPGHALSRLSRLPHMLCIVCLYHVRRAHRHRFPWQGQGKCKRWHKTSRPLSITILVLLHPIPIVTSPYFQGRGGCSSSVRSMPPILVLSPLDTEKPCLVLDREHAPCSCSPVLISLYII